MAYKWSIQFHESKQLVHIKAARYAPDVAVLHKLVFFCKVHNCCDPFYLHCLGVDAEVAVMFRKVGGYFQCLCNGTGVHARWQCSCHGPQVLKRLVGIRFGNTEVGACAGIVIQTARFEQASSIHLFSDCSLPAYACGRLNRLYYNSWGHIQQWICKLQNAGGQATGQQCSGRGSQHS